LSAKLDAATTLLLLQLPLPPPRCHRCGTCHAAIATAKLPPLPPPTPLCRRTAAMLPPLPCCRHLCCRAAAATTAAVQPLCLPLLCFCHRRPAATANAGLPSMTPLPLFSLSLLLLSSSPFPSLLLHWF
jgi:hypothetical protein